MVLKIDNIENILTILNIDIIDDIDGIIFSPSLVEYHLGNIVCNLDSEVYLNFSQIERSFNITDRYILYKDYENNFYIEVKKDTNFEEESLF